MRTESDFEQVGTASRPGGVEIVRYRPRFAAGSGAGRRARRLVTGLFVIAALAAATALVAYLTWPRDDQRYTSVLGITVAVALAALGSGVVSLSMLLPAETAVERRPDDRPTGAVRRRLARPLTRRPLLTGAVALGAVTASAPLAARLLRDPHAPTDRRLDTSPMEHTGWHPAWNGGQPVRLVREDGTPIRPAEVSVGGLVTAFPGIPGGTGNQHADSPVMVIHLRREDAARLRENLYEVNRDGLAGDFVAYSKICTHVGCPASLYEQQTDRLLCPCHQSQFLVTDNARPVFGPAARSLAMLPITVDDQGFFVAISDFRVPVGPSYWER